MSEQDNENLDSENQAADEIVSDTDNNENEQDDSADDSDDSGKLKELNKRLFERAKKAEGELKKLKVHKPEAKSEPIGDQSLSQMDIINLVRSNVSDEDIPEVVEYAKFKKISVSEALKSSVIQVTLKQKAEERKSAEVANTGKTKSSKNQISDDTLLEMAEKGTLPDDDGMMDRLAKARFDKKKSK